MSKYLNQWEVKGDLRYCGDTLVRFILDEAKKHIPEYFDLFPFKAGWKSKVFYNESVFCIQLVDVFSQFPIMGEVITDDDLVNGCIDLVRENEYPNFDTVYNNLDKKAFDFELFTYIGKLEGKKLCWPHIANTILDWANKVVIPRIVAMNTKRIADAIPIPPSFNTFKLFENIFVVESAKAAIQGTVSFIQGIGFVTCDHCIRDHQTRELLDDLVIFRGPKFSEKFKATVEKANTDIDLAILSSTINIIEEGLAPGKSDDLNQLDHIGIAGFPNYNIGDQGIFTPGIVTGFRSYSGIRHIIVNCPIIAGTSGGPCFDKQSTVIGIAVTGAEIMDEAHKTEKHALIPIEAIKYIN